MDTIIKFLKNNWTEQPADEQFNVAEQNLDKLNKLFAGQKIISRKNSHTHILPKANQVWAVKNEYYDFLGNKQTASHPFLVTILTDIDSFEEEDFVRVAVISPFYEMASEQDDVCRDASIAGFPFLFENWNDQPVLLEILDEYVGYYEPKYISDKEEQLSSIQKEFREIEIANAKFLNNSVSALVGFVEMNQNNEFAAVVSFNNQSLIQGCPKSDNEIVNNETTLELPPQEDIALSKTTLITKNKGITFNNKELPFEIQVKKTDNGFIISALTSKEITLFSADNKSITPISNGERQVFASLKKGLYTLKSATNQEPIKIRLK
jgi:hypothetical protein